MAIVPYRYTLKRTAKLWGSLGFCSFSSDNFFVVTYTFFSLVLTFDFWYSQLIFFCILFKKDTKINKWKRWRNILKKLNSLKKGEGVPLLNFVGSPVVPILNFEVGLGVPLLNFEGGLGVLVPLLHHGFVNWVSLTFYWRTNHIYNVNEICTHLRHELMRFVHTAR